MYMPYVCTMCVYCMCIHCLRVYCVSHVLPMVSRVIFIVIDITVFFWNTRILHSCAFPQCSVTLRYSILEFIEVMLIHSHSTYFVTLHFVLFDIHVEFLMFFSLGIHVTYSILHHYICINPLPSPPYNTFE